ncbi:MAG: glycosyltransferase family 2 protein [Candidatus Micrarchaeota archaeon]|nr:glycosyltransferase family 2 protein [Candidatus Micrarchaeota archaeon]
MPAQIFYPYAIFIVLLSLGMLALVLRRYEQERRPKGYFPKTLVIVPCKGLDLTLEQNLRSLQKQNYPKYDVVCVVDKKSDESLKVIRKLGIRSVLSDAKAQGSGKVRAIATALQKYGDYGVYVTADSDVCFGNNWLAGLVAPLSDKSYGLSTSYPFFNPVGGFWSKVKSAWGLVGEGLLESNVTRFGWGGSLAFRNGFLGRKDLERFKKSLSDDIALTTINQERGLKIFYSNDLGLVVNQDDGAQQFVEWANRQTALSILGNPSNFYFGVAFYLAQILLLISPIVMAIFYTPLFLVLLAPIILGMLRGYFRLKRKFGLYFVISLALPFLYLTNLLLAKGVREITWRGSSYRLKKV